MNYYGVVWSFRDSLAHYGIKGQKWGLRRYQYENGSYTPEGIERYRPSKQMDRMWKVQSKKLDKYNRNANLGFQKGVVETEKYFALDNMYKGIRDIGLAVGSKAVQNVIMPKHERVMLPITNPQVYKTNKIADKVTTYGLGGIGVARLISATTHGLKALNAQRKVSAIGHKKAVAKRDEQYQKMLDIFSNTPYADLLEEQAKLNK